MLTSIVVSIVKTCTRFAIPVVLVTLALAIAAGYYTSQNFQINTDINTLISAKLDWRQRDNQFDKAFDRDSTILAVVDSPTPELTSAAAAALEQKLTGDTKHFSSVQPLGSGEFFEKNGLLYLPEAEVRELTGQFASAAPLIEIMAGDPSIRGLTGALETGLAGVKRGQVKLDSTERPFNLIARTIEDVLKNGNRDLFLARTRQRQAADRLPTGAPSSSSSRSSTSTRSSPARRPPTRSGRPPPISISPVNITRASG